MEPRIVNQPRILIVEDSDDDAQLLLRELKRGGVEPIFRRVETIAGVKEALQQGAWDIVISDYNLPQQSFPEIMQAIRAHDADIPVIVVSGSIGEENAVALMREGVADFIFKGSLSRLIPAMQREFAAAAAKIARAESDQRFRDIVEVSGDWIWETDAEHRYTFLSNRYEEVDWADPRASLGKTPWELAGANVAEDEHWQAHVSDRDARQAFRNFLFSLSRDSDRPDAGRRGFLARRGGGGASDRRRWQHFRRLCDLRPGRPHRHGERGFPQALRGRLRSGGSGRDVRGLPPHGGRTRPLSRRRGP
jgi:CheY-like chemotaxis protein